MDEHFRTSGLPTACPERTEALVELARSQLDPSHPRFEAFTALAPRLGGNYVGDGVATFGFYAPHLADIGVSPGDVFVEILSPVEPLTLDVSEATFELERVLVPLIAVGPTYWAAAKGIVAGDRDKVGHLYALRYRDWQGHWGVYLDPLARSLPFGAFGPAELYDIESIQAERQDRGWFEATAASTPPDADGVPRFGPPSNIPEVHVGTATPGGTVRSLDGRQEIQGRFSSVRCRRQGGNPARYPCMSGASHRVKGGSEPAQGRWGPAGSGQRRVRGLETQAEDR